MPGPVHSRRFSSGHIQQLRAELAASIDQAKRQQIAAELEAAIAKNVEEEAAFHTLVSAVRSIEGGFGADAGSSLRFRAITELPSTRMHIGLPRS